MLESLRRFPCPESSSSKRRELFDQNAGISPRLPWIPASTTGSASSRPASGRCIKHIPNYRVELGAGFEYRNRTASGQQPGLALDSRNTGKLLFEANIFPFDGRYRSRIRGEGFVARKAFLSDMDYSGGTVEWNNRYLVDKDGKNTLELTTEGRYFSSAKFL